MATIAIALANINLVRFSPLQSSFSRSSFNAARCSPIQQIQVDSEIACEPCNGRGWILCDFCEGQKTNVKAENNRIYRRCPSCRAVGYILCSKCKVFKCVTFPNYSDGNKEQCFDTRLLGCLQRKTGCYFLLQGVSSLIYIIGFVTEGSGFARFHLQVSVKISKKIILQSITRQ